MAGLEDGEVLIHDPPRHTGMSIEQFEQLADRIDGRGDPAFAVAFLEAMGVNGMVGLPPFFEGVANQAWDHDRPREDHWSSSRLSAWVDEQMVPVAAVMATAMDTRARTTVHHDPAFEQLPDDARLVETWVDRFERYGGDEQVAYSQLVKDAELPADVLVGVGNHHLGDVFGHPQEDRGLASNEAALNILDAIAANADASVGWLGSDGIAEGTDNIELVLTYEGHGRVGGEFYGGMAEVVESGLTHPTDIAGRGELMRDVIIIVGADGDTLWDPEETDRADAAVAHMHQALANGAAANMDVVDSMINDDWGDVVFDEPPETAGLTHDFFREVMQDDTAAHRVTGAYETWALDQLSHLPAPGVDGTPGTSPTDQEAALRGIGAVEGVIIHAENNALLGSIEERINRQQARAGFVDIGVDGAAYAAGFIPVYGQGIGALETASDMAGLSVGDAIFPADYAALDEVTQQARANEVDARINFAILTTIAEHPEAVPAGPIGQWSDEERRTFIDLLRPSYDVHAHAQLMEGFSAAEDEFGGVR